jgi:hypothetical protein
VILRPFEPADGEQKRPRPRGRAVYRAVVARGLGRELQDLVEIREPDRLEVVEPADTAAGLDNVVRQAGEGAPVGRHQHRRQMPTGRVTGYEDAVGVAAERGRVPVNPHDRGAALAHELVHVDGGDQRVVDHDDRRAGRLKPARDEARIGLVEPVPVAAVDEHVHGGRPAARGEDVEALAGVRTVGEIEAALERGARLGAGHRVPRQPVGAVFDLLAVVVLGVESLLVVLAEDALRHPPPTMPKAPGACQ